MIPKILFMVVCTCTITSMLAMKKIVITAKTAKQFFKSSSPEQSLTVDDTSKILLDETVNNKKQNLISTIQMLKYQINDDAAPGENVTILQNQLNEYQEELSKINGKYINV